MLYKMIDFSVSYTRFGMLFDFTPDNVLLTDFLHGDSEMIFGHQFERYHEIMAMDYYQSHGNAYEILLNNDTVTVTNILYVIFPDAVDDPSSTILKKDDFMFIMNEWIRYSSDKSYR